MLALWDATDLQSTNVCMVGSRVNFSNLSPRLASKMFTCSVVSSSAQKRSPSLLFCQSNTSLECAPRSAPWLRLYESERCRRRLLWIKGQVNGVAKDRPSTHGPQFEEKQGVYSLMSATAVHNGRSLVLSAAAAETGRLAEAVVVR